MNGVKGIHHITAIAGSPQENINFYNDLLGLKFLKRTVNFDDPYTYHFYYGDETGTPGTILTFFPWGKEAMRGKRGSGQVTTISFSVKKNTLPYWIERLKKAGVNVSDIFSRFDEEVILFEDPDGIEIELISASNDNRPGWDNGQIPSEYSILGFYTASLSETNAEATKNLLTDQLQYKKTKKDRNRIRFESGEGEPGTYIDVVETASGSKGLMGVGAIHHIAFRAKDDMHQLELKKILDEKGFNVTPVIDRNYFHSIYFREPGNILFEIATDPPGFLIDESKEELGKHLKLPSWYEVRRKEIERRLPDIMVNNYKAK
jgi:glyoxalase family protein